MSDSASVTTSSLAIAEKRPRKTGGCVGIFFQLFDWNRRFAKKKLFSKRLLPPDHAKEASKKFGGDDKLPKLRLIADENSGGFPNKNKNGVTNYVGKNGVQTPSLVARLMGLESMPSVKRDKLQKDSFWGGRRESVFGDSEELEKETSKQEVRPQKLQKTGMAERRNVTRFGAEALQLKNVLSRSRKHHHHHHPKLASPVKTTGHQTRRNTSLFMGAATRILEPGLQSRGKSKYAITYAHSARRPPGNELRLESNMGEVVDLSSGQACCKNCGNLVESTSKRDNHTSTIKSVQMSPNGKSRYVCSSLDQEVVVHIDNGRHVTDTKDFVALNMNLSGQRRSRALDTKFDKRSKFESGYDGFLSSGQKRQLRKQGESCSNRPRMRHDGYSVDGVCIPDYKGVGSKVGAGGYKNSNGDGMPFRFSSVTKNRREVPANAERRRNHYAFPCKTTSSNPSDEKICLQRPTGRSLGAIFEEKLQELANQVVYENGTPPERRTSANIFEDLICALNRESRNYMEFSPQRNHLPQYCNQYNTRFSSKTKPERAASLAGYKNIDHLSPGYVLEAYISNDSCFSSSLEDSHGRTHADSMSYSYDESQFPESEKDPFHPGVSLIKYNILAADLLSNITEALCSVCLFNPRIKGNMLVYAKEVIFNADLVLGTQMLHNPNNITSFFMGFLVLELDTLAEVTWARCGNLLGSKNPNARYQLKRFVFDSLIEYLDSKYSKYLKCGFRTWMKHPAFMGCDVLIREVVEEVRRWRGFVRETADELVERDMNHCFGNWKDFEIEAYETAAKIQGDILQMLINEVVSDLTAGIASL